MRRFWVDEKYKKEDTFEIINGSFHHICHVCRQVIGDKFEILVGDGRAYFVELTTVTKKFASAKILEFREIPELPTPRITLALSIPRFQKMDWILEKCVEMGVARVIPFVSDNSFVRRIDAQLDLRTSRWEKIVQSATEQCGRGHLMRVEKTLNFQDVIKLFNHDSHKLGLFCYEGMADRAVRPALTLLKSHEPSPQEVWIFIGSEGGFTQEEVQYFVKSGLHPVTLGSQVLRVETACLAVLSVIKYEFDLMA